MCQTAASTSALLGLQSLLRARNFSRLRSKILFDRWSEIFFLFSSYSVKCGFMLFRKGGLFRIDGGFFVLQRPYRPTNIFLSLKGKGGWKIFFTGNKDLIFFSFHRSSDTVILFWKMPFLKRFTAGICNVSLFEYSNRFFETYSFFSGIKFRMDLDLENKQFLTEFIFFFSKFISIVLLRFCIYQRTKHDINVWKMKPDLLLCSFYRIYTSKINSLFSLYHWRNNVGC